MKQSFPIRLTYIPQSDQRRKVSRVVIVPSEPANSSYDPFVVAESKNKTKPIHPSQHRTDVLHRPFGGSQELQQDVLDTQAYLKSQKGDSLPISTITHSYDKPSPVDPLFDLNKQKREARRALNRKLRLWCVTILTVLALLFFIGIIVAILVIVLLPKTTTTTSVGSASTTTTTTISLLWNETGITVAGVTSTTGNTPTTLNLPSGIAFDSSDALYVADATNNRVQKFVSGSLTGTTVANQTSSAGCSAVGYIYYPLDVFVNANYTVFVTDSGCNNIRIWPEGVTTGIFFAGTGNPPGSGSHQFYSPSGITVDSITGTIYISDTGNNRVMAYPVGATNGTRVAGGNATGTANSQLNNPGGLYFDGSSNSLVIANTGAHNVVRWALGASTWTLVAVDTNGNSGSTSTRLTSPQDVIKDSIGNIYVADTGNYRIQFFLAGQTNGTTIVGTGSGGSSASDLNGPYSVALDSQLNLYVADRLNQRVQKFLRY